MCQSIVQQEIHISCFMSTDHKGAVQGTATTSGDVAHDLSKANALSNALAVMCGEPSPNRALLTSPIKASAALSLIRRVCRSG